MAQRVKRLPTMQENQGQSLGREDLLEKEMATHSTTLAWKISWTEEPGRLQSMGLQTVRHNWATSLFCCWAGLCSLPCRWTWDQTMVEVMKKMATSFKRCAWTDWKLSLPSAERVLSSSPSLSSLSSCRYHGVFFYVPGIKLSILLSIAHLILTKTL